MNYITIATILILTIGNSHGDPIKYRQIIDPKEYAGIIFEEKQTVAFIEGSRDVTLTMEFSLKEKNILDLKNSISALQAIAVSDAPNEFKDSLNIYTPIHRRLLYAAKIVKEIGLMTATETEEPERKQENHSEVFLESKFNKIADTILKIKQDIDQGVRDLPQNMQKANKQTREKFVAQVLSITVQAKTKIDENMAYLEIILKGLQQSQKNRLAAGILPIDQYKRVEQIFEKTCSMPQINVTNDNEIGQWIEASHEIKDKKIYFKLKIPCISKKDAKLYKIHPVHIPQIIDNNTYMAYIKPLTSHLLIENDLFYHAEMTDFEKCQIEKNIIKCPAQWFPMQEQLDCESTLLMRPAEKNYNTCHIEYTKIREDYVNYMETTGEIIYILHNPRRIKYTCVTQQGEITLNGAGIIKARENCEIDIKGVKTQGIKNEKRKQIIWPKQRFQINEMTKTFQDENRKEIFRTLSRDDGLTDFWKIIIKTQEIYRTEKLFGIGEFIVRIAVLTAMILSAAVITNFVLIIQMKCSQRASKRSVRISKGHPIVKEYEKMEYEIIAVPKKESEC